MTAPYLLTLPTHGTPAYGWLTVAEAPELPFAVKRVYWITQVPPAQVRGRHAHRSLEQLLVAVQGTVHVTVKSAAGERQSFTLAHPSQALYVPPGSWREISFEPGAALLALASQEYDEADYLRD